MPFAASTDTAGPWVELIVQGQANLLSAVDAGNTASGSTGTWAGTGCTLAQTGPTAPDGSFPLRLTSTAGTNMLDAASSEFETGVGSWADWNGNSPVSSSTVQAHSGTHSLAITASNTSTPKVGVFGGIGPFAVVPGVTYTFSSWVRAGSTARTLNLSMQWYSDQALNNQTGAPSTASIVDSSTAWTFVTLTGQAPANTNWMVPFFLGSGGWAVSEVHYLDSVSLTVGAANISAVTGNYGVVPEQVYTGVVALQTAVTGRSTQAQMVWKDSGGATISTTSGLYSSDGPGAYTLATVTDDAPPNATSVDLQVVLLATTNAEVHYAASRAILPGPGPLWSPGGNAGLETALVQSSDDQGATWQTLRYGLNAALPAPSQQAKVTDWEPTPNIARLYRTTISDPNGRVSVVTTPVEAVVSPDRCWLIDVLQPDAGGRLGFFRARAGGSIAGVGSSFTWTQVEQQTKLQPLKDPTSPAEVPPLILRGGMQAPTTSLLIYLPGEPAKRAFKALRARQRTLLLQTDGYEHEYVSIDGQVVYDQVRAGDRTYNPTWIATVPLTATAAP